MNMKKIIKNFRQNKYFKIKNLAKNNLKQHN